MQRSLVYQRAEGESDKRFGTQLEVHDTGEGSISQHHRVHGRPIWENGSGYFGCRNDDGTFSEERFVANAREMQVKMTSAPRRQA